MAEGRLAPGQDLCAPAFYFSRELDEQWALDRISQAIERCPSIVQGAEQKGTAMERAFYRKLYRLGFAPPFYRFLPVFLRSAPVRALRARGAAVRASCRKPGEGTAKLS